MPGPRPLHYRPLIFYPVGEESILPGLFAPPPTSAGRRGRRPLQSRVLIFSSKSIQSVLFDKILIKRNFLLIVTAPPAGYTTDIPSKSQAAPQQARGLIITGGTLMYYSAGNYEAFATPKKPANVDGKSAYIVGSGLAALSAACYLVRDAQMKGEHVHILEKDPSRAVLRRLPLREPRLRHARRARDGQPL